METGQPEGTQTQIAPPPAAAAPATAPIAELSDEELKAKIEAKKAGPAGTQDTRTVDPAKPPDTPPKVETKPTEPDHQKTIAEQKSMIGRQGSEIGLLRAKVAELQKEIISSKAKGAPPPAEDPDRAAKNQKFIEDPLTALDEELAKRDKLKEESTAADKAASKANFEAVVQALPGVDIHELMPHMFQVALDDGVPEEDVIEFARNPFKTPPQALIALAKRAKAERELREMRNPPAKKPAEKGNGKPLRTLTASSGQSGTTEVATVSRARLAEMSDEELKAYKSELERKARLGK
jgi:hypothetical protein